MQDYIEYYNERCLHFALDIRNYETPLKAFSTRKPTDAIRKDSPRWMEVNTDEWRT